MPIPSHGPWQEFPLHESSNFEDGDEPGPVRVIYTTQEYDVVYHDPKKKKKRGRQTNGAMKKVADFSRARRVSRRVDRRASV